MFFVTFSIFAQQEAGVWSTISIDKKIYEKWNLGAETELRTYGGTDIYLVEQIERWTLTANVGYSPVKPLNLSATYILMDVFDRKYDNYQWQHRFYLSAAGKQNWGNFSFSLRERLQTTTKNDSKRIKPDGSIDAYKVKTDMVWRNRLLVAYNISDFPITPSASVETFYTLNNPDGNKINEVRYILSLAYKINSKNTFELYGLYRQDPSNPSKEGSYGIYILGLSYKISL